MCYSWTGTNYCWQHKLCLSDKWQHVSPFHSWAFSGTWGFLRLGETIMNKYFFVFQWRTLLFRSAPYLTSHLLSRRLQWSPHRSPTNFVPQHTGKCFHLRALSYATGTDKVHHGTHLIILEQYVPHGTILGALLTLVHQPVGPISQKGTEWVVSITLLNLQGLYARSGHQLV